MLYYPVCSIKNHRATALYKLFSTIEACRHSSYHQPQLYFVKCLLPDKVKANMLRW